MKGEIDELIEDKEKAAQALEETHAEYSQKQGNLEKELLNHQAELEKQTDELEGQQKALEEKDRALEK